MKFGTSYSYWGNVWSCDYKEVIQKVAGIGFNMLEVGADHLYHMDAEKLSIMRTVSSEQGITLIANSGPAREYDLASKEEAVRNNGINYFKTVMNKMKEVGSSQLIGAVYSFWPSDFSDIDKEGAWKRSIKSLKELAKTAEALNIYISLEVLNRYETYILTDCAEAKEYCKRIGSNHINILLDTFHMNIEEDDQPTAIRNAGDMLGHLHVGEGNRKLPGRGTSIDWSGIGKALNEIHYERGVVMEPFVLPGGEVGKDIKVWRDLSNGATQEELTQCMANSLMFLKKYFVTEV